MKRIILLALLLAAWENNAQARLAATCGGAVLAADKKTGVHKSQFLILDYQVGYGARTSIAVSIDGKLVQIAYPKCVPNTNKDIPDKFLPAEYPDLPAIATVTLSVPALLPSTFSASVEWMESLKLLSGNRGPNPEFQDGSRRFVYDDEAVLCLFEEQAQKWCDNLDPYAAKRAGGSMSLWIYRLGSDYLVVTDFNGAFLIDPRTGSKKWNYEFSNLDAVPVAAEAAQSLIFSPRQEWLRDN